MPEDSGIDEPKTMEQIMVGMIPDRFRRLSINHHNGDKSTGGLMIKWYWSHTSEWLGTYTGVCGEYKATDPCPMAAYRLLDELYHSDDNNPHAPRFRSHRHVDYDVVESEEM